MFVSDGAICRRVLIGMFATFVHTKNRYGTGIWNRNSNSKTRNGILNTEQKQSNLKWEGIPGTPRNSSKLSVYDMHTNQNSLNQPETARNTHDGLKKTRYVSKQPAKNSQPRIAFKL